MDGAARVLDHKAKRLFPAGAVVRAELLRDDDHPVTGRRLPELYRQAGLADVGAECMAPLHPAGYPRRAIRLDLVRSMVWGRKPGRQPET